MVSDWSSSQISLACESDKIALHPLTARIHEDVDRSPRWGSHQAGDALAATTGQNEILLMNGVNQIGVVCLPILLDPNYSFVGAADYNGDGKLDLILRNSVTGANAVWIMNGTSYVSTIDLPFVNSNYEIDGPR
jgi:hypothetical protein